MHRLWVGIGAHANHLNEFGGLAWVIGAWAVMMTGLVLLGMWLFLGTPGGSGL